jgi:splicing factor 45
MAPEPSSSKSSGMLSLYANLLEPSAAEIPSPPGTISRAPVVFKQSLESDPQLDDSAAKKQQISAGSELPSFHD